VCNLCTGSMTRIPRHFLQFSTTYTTAVWTSDSQFLVKLSLMYQVCIVISLYRNVKLYCKLSFLPYQVGTTATVGGMMGNLPASSPHARVCLLGLQFDPISPQNVNFGDNTGVMCCTSIIIFCDICFFSSVSLQASSLTCVVRCQLSFTFICCKYDCRLSV